MPAVQTGSPTQITPLTATLHGTVNDCGSRGSTAWFVIKPATGQAMTTARQKMRAARKPASADARISGLHPGVRYTVQLEASIAGRRYKSGQASFGTARFVLQTLPATDITGTGATLNATASARKAPGVKMSYTWTLAGRPQGSTARVTVPADVGTHSFPTPLTGLAPDTQYGYDAVLTAPNGVRVACGCAKSFTTGPGPAAHLTVTAPSDANAGQSFTVSATATDANNVSLGDVSAVTTFTITPNGSCVATSCTVTHAGPHTVHGVDGAAAADAGNGTTVSPGALDHLQVSPSAAHVCALQASSNQADYHCPVGSSTFQTFNAEGFDQYGNDLGDETSATTFSIPAGGGVASCGQSGCSTGASTAQYSVQGTDGSANGTATLTGDVPLTMTCQGRYYDVNGDASDGCEVADSGTGVGTQSAADSGSAAASAPECDSGTNNDIHISGSIPSDSRTHQNPPVTGFDTNSGSMPHWFWISPVANTFCHNDLVLQLHTSGEASSASNNCYELSVTTNLQHYSVRTSAVDGTASINQNSGGQWSDAGAPAHIDVEVSKVCTAAVTENVSWTLTGHL